MTDWASIGHPFDKILGDSRKKHAGMTALSNIILKVSGSEYYFIKYVHLTRDFSVNHSDETKIKKRVKIKIRGTLILEIS